MPYIELPSGQALLVTKRYKHLGGVISPGGSIVADAARKVVKARSALAAITGPILRQRRLTMQYGRALMIALIDARLLTGTGQWGQVPVATLRSMEAVRMRAGRALLAKAPWDCDDDEVRVLRATPSLERRISAQRLRYACRLSRRGPAQLRALVRAGGGVWAEALLCDVQAMRQALPNLLAELPFPTEVDDLKAWEQMWLAAPAGWGQLVRRFGNHVSSQQTPLLQAGQDRLLNLALSRAGGTSLQPGAWLRHEEGCHARFDTHCALASQNFCAHAISNPIRARI